MSTSNSPSKSSTTSKRRPAMIIAMIPVGAVLGLLGGLLIEIIVGLIARAAFSAEHPADFSWHFLGSLPGLGALIGAIVMPILYARSARGPATR
jgi:prolipoprotein diacylglyceryltransferase